MFKCLEICFDNFLLYLFNDPIELAALAQKMQKDQPKHADNIKLMGVPREFIDRMHKAHLEKYR